MDKSQAPVVRVAHADGTVSSFTSWAQYVAARNHAADCACALPIAPEPLWARGYAHVAEQGA